MAEQNVLFALASTCFVLIDLHTLDDLTDLHISRTWLLWGTATLDSFRRIHQLLLVKQAKWASIANKLTWPCRLWAWTIIVGSTKISRCLIAWENILYVLQRVHTRLCHWICVHWGLVCILRQFLTSVEVFLWCCTLLLPYTRQVTVLSALSRFLIQGHLWLNLTFLSPIHVSLRVRLCVIRVLVNLAVDRILT